MSGCASSGTNLNRLGLSRNPAQESIQNDATRLATRSALTSTYARRGRLDITARNGVTTNLRHNGATQLLAEQRTGGSLGNLTLTSALRSRRLRRDWPLSSPCALLERNDQRPLTTDQLSEKEQMHKLRLQQSTTP